MLCRKKIRTGIALIAATVLLGCASQEGASDIDEDELHTLPGRFADEPVTEPLTAVEAYIGKDEFFLAYEGPDGLVYSGGNWSNRVSAPRLPRAGRSTAARRGRGRWRKCERRQSRHL